MKIDSIESLRELFLDKLPRRLNSKNNKLYMLGGDCYDLSSEVVAHLKNKMCTVFDSGKLDPKKDHFSPNQPTFFDLVKKKEDYYFLHFFSLDGMYSVPNESNFYFKLNPVFYPELEENLSTQTSAERIRLSIMRYGQISVSKGNTGCIYRTKKLLENDEYYIVCGTEKILINSKNKQLYFDVALTAARVIHGLGGSGRDRLEFIGQEIEAHLGTSTDGFKALDLLQEICIDNLFHFEEKEVDDFVIGQHCLRAMCEFTQCYSKLLDKCQEKKKDNKYAKHLKRLNEEFTAHLLHMHRYKLVRTTILESEMGTHSSIKHIPPQYICERLRDFIPFDKTSISEYIEHMGQHISEVDMPSFIRFCNQHQIILPEDKTEVIDTFKQWPYFYTFLQYVVAHRKPLSLVFTCTCQLKWHDLVELYKVQKQFSRLFETELQLFKKHLYNLINKQKDDVCGSTDYDTLIDSFYALNDIQKDNISFQLELDTENLYALLSIYKRLEITCITGIPFFFKKLAVPMKLDKSLLKRLTVKVPEKYFHFLNYLPNRKRAAILHLLRINKRLRV